MSTIVYFIMNILGEMTTYLPMRGVCVPYFINRFTEPSLGFAIGQPSHSAGIHCSGTNQV